MIYAFRFPRRGLAFRADRLVSTSAVGRVRLGGFFVSSTRPSQLGARELSHGPLLAGFIPPSALLQRLPTGSNG